MNNNLEYPIILDMPWFEIHNPNIDQRKLSNLTEQNTYGMLPIIIFNLFMITFPLLIFLLMISSLYK